MFIELAKGVAFLLALCTIQGFISSLLQRRETVRDVVSGLAYGAVCVVGMMTPIVLAPGVIFDARSVVIAVSGLLGGPLAAAVSAAIAGGYRLYLGGAGAPVGLAVVVVCVALGLAYREAARRRWVRFSFPELLIFGFFVHLAVIGLFTFLPEPIAQKVMETIAIPMVATFTVATALLAWLLKMIQDRIGQRRSLEEANLRFSQIADNIRDIFYITNPERTEMIYISPAYEKVWGRSCESLYRSPRSYFDAIHPDDVAGVIEITDRHRYEEFEHSYRIIQPDGSIRSIRSQAFPVRNEKGEVYRIAGVVEDVTEMEERLAQLRQAQKMEALGQLTGGVAHDFNNLLQIIQGNSELLQEEGAATPAALEAIMRASQRGSDLTQRLLSFARRQPLQAAPVDVAALVDRVDALLKRTLGANIEFRSEINPGLWLAMADAAQLENALVNLAINARDAMPDGGTLVFEATNITGVGGGELSPDRDYVRIAVIDNGDGMPDSVRRQAFEPFFTTKDVGRGSGLGLSMVYGFAKQSDGHVEIDSREGAGTTVTLYLPSAKNEAQTDRPAAASDCVRGGGQTVLVVEDEEDVRRMAVAFVESLGYRTMEAASAEEVYDLLDRASGSNGAADAVGEIDAILCDVALPGGVNGPDVVRRFLEARPGTKVIFMSGYPPGRGRDLAAGPENGIFLQKPFRKNDLSDALSRALV